MSRLTLLSTLDGVDPLPVNRLGPPVRHAQERHAALLASPAHRQREANAAFEKRVHPTPDGQYTYAAGKAPELAPGYDHFVQAVDRTKRAPAVNKAPDFHEHQRTYVAQLVTNALRAMPPEVEEGRYSVLGAELAAKRATLSAAGQLGAQAAHASKAQPPAPQPRPFSGTTEVFYNGVWNKVVDLFKDYLHGCKNNINFEALRIALGSSSNSLFTEHWITTQNSVVLAEALLALADEAPNVRGKPSAPAAPMLTGGAQHLLKRYIHRCGDIYMRCPPHVAGQLVSTALAACNIPTEPLPEDDEDDEFEAAQLRAYVAQGKD